MSRSAEYAIQLINIIQQKHRELTSFKRVATICLKFAKVRQVCCFVRKILKLAVIIK